VLIFPWVTVEIDEELQAHPPLHVMEAVTAAEISAPELQTHCVIYELLGNEVAALGHFWHT